jgi:hypothetical protein
VTRLLRATMGVAAFLTIPIARSADLEIPRQYIEAVQRANSVGMEIFAHDAAASRATDELLSRKVVETDQRLRGWLTERSDEGDDHAILVTFVGEEGDATVALYRLRVPVEGRTIRYQALAPAVPLSAPQAAGWKARMSAKQELEKRPDLCGEHYNTVVLPAGTVGKGIRVYMLAATSQPDLMIAGGHFLYEYSEDGSKLLSQRAFTRSCIDLPLKGDPEKGEVAALTLSHLLDPTPTEIHVFLNRNYGKSLYLLTTQNKLIWVVTEGAIIGAEHLPKK